MDLAPLDPSQQFCFNHECPDYGEVGKGNVYIHSYKERRYGCHPCKGTFAETRGTMFYRLRTPPETIGDAIAQLVERGSIRGVARAKGVFARHGHRVAAPGRRARRRSQRVLDAGPAPDRGPSGRTLDLCEKKQKNLSADEDTGGNDGDLIGDAWIWQAVDVPSRLRIASHLSHARGEDDATAFIGQGKARSDEQAPLFQSDGLPASTAALVANYSEPEPPPFKRGPGRPRTQPKRLRDPDLRSTQVDKRKEKGRVVEVSRRIVFGQPAAIAEVIERGGGASQGNTAYVERNNLTLRQTNGRLVRKALSYSKDAALLYWSTELDDAVYNLTHQHWALRQRPAEPETAGRKWCPRTPAMAAGLTDHPWTLLELLTFKVPPSRSGGT
jgi:hypothetical protein